MGEKRVGAPEKAVFLCNDISELSLADAQKLVEYLEDKLNITVIAFGAATIAAPGIAVEVPAIVGEKLEFDVVFECWVWTVLALLGVWRGLVGETLDDSVMVGGWNDSVMEWESSTSEVTGTQVPKRGSHRLLTGTEIGPRARERQEKGEKKNRVE
ncbi:hypothetical protein RJ640_011119 [Escallonia rubra]|uniref:Large ribosomal subunit protein bL12 oligomerization domain-containing protein n=1 Tax=Escallonia rubra TaxID=112253 RepID=A0AA88R2G0_9ASTE|nr:hypothetical protein RJ640_011119 [Escallonia rubra]